MKQDRHSWLAAPNVDWKWVLLATFIWSAAGLATYWSALGSYLEARIASPLNFRSRDLMGKGPELSPNLRIYNIDDSTFDNLGTWVMTLEEWAQVLEALDKRRPKAIVIDAMFSKVVNSHENVTGALERIRALKTPVIVGSYVDPKRLRYRVPLELMRPDYSLAMMTGMPEGTPLPPESLPPMWERNEWYAYGPDVEIRDTLKHIGHFLYGGQGKVSPLIRLGADTVIPHLTLFVASERKIDQGRLIVDGHMVPVDSRGQVTVNFPGITKFWDTKNTRSMNKLITMAKTEGVAPNNISEGDVILILPHMYTGNTDFKMTPYGAMPAGFVLASMINSVMTGQWLKPLAGAEILIVGLSLGGALLGMQLGALGFWIATTLVLAGGFALCQVLFAWSGIIVEWLLPLGGFLLTGVTVFAEKTRVGERKVRVLRDALEGAVAASDLKELLKNPGKVSFEARERVVTLMFIDVVGFSLLAENMLPRMAFDNLKRMISTIGDTIHQFGGIIDKTLGDGLLCYFGYRFDADSSSPDHAEKALRCAVKIQQDNLRRNLDAAENGEPVYPLRIGINTASCYLGDLGAGDRIEFTVVGNGVNFAKRLEGACEMHSVLVGATTYDLIKGIGIPSLAVTRRFIRIKHHSELVEAYEYDPFYDQTDLRAAAIEGFRKCANIERVDHRWPVHDPTKIKLMCDFGEGQLVNFSHSGFSIRLPQLLAKGTRLNVSLDSGGGALKAMLAREGIEVMQGDVRWGYADGDGFVHGVLLSSLSAGQSEAMVQYLCEFAFTRDARKDPEQDGLKKEAS